MTRSLLSTLSIADGWLKEFYADWEIIEHPFATSPLIDKFHEDRSVMTRVVEKKVSRVTSGHLILVSGLQEIDHDEGCFGDVHMGLD